METKTAEEIKQCIAECERAYSLNPEYYRGALNVYRDWLKDIEQTAQLRRENNLQAIEIEAFREHRKDLRKLLGIETGSTSGAVSKLREENERLKAENDRMDKVLHSTNNRIQAELSKQAELFAYRYKQLTEESERLKHEYNRLSKGTFVEEKETGVSKGEEKASDIVGSVVNEGDHIEGSWRDSATGKTYPGGGTVRRYPAGLFVQEGDEGITPLSDFFYIAKITRANNNLKGE